MFFSAQNKLLRMAPNNLSQISLQHCAKGNKRYFSQHYSQALPLFTLPFLLNKQCHLLWMCVHEPEFHGYRSRCIQCLRVLQCIHTCAITRNKKKKTTFKWQKACHYWWPGCDMKVPHLGFSDCLLWVLLKNVVVFDTYEQFIWKKHMYCTCQG